MRQGTYEALGVEQYKGNWIYKNNHRKRHRKDRKKTKNNQKTITEKDTKQLEDIEIYKRIIDHLNMVCGTNYKYTTSSSQKDIKARLKEEYTEQDFYTVIDKKSKEWKGTERERYLRPSTLFGNKFGEYLNQRIVKEQRHGEIDILDEWRNS